MYSMTDEKSPQQPKCRWWPIGTYLTAVLGLNLATIPIAESLPQSANVEELLMSGCTIGEATVAAVIAGLCGRVWLQGLLLGTFFLAAALGFVEISMYCLARYSSFSNIGKGWELLLVPAFVFFLATPLLTCRYLWGWRLSQRQPETTFRVATKIEDLFLMTAAVASLLALLRIPPMVWEQPEPAFYAMIAFLGVMQFAFGAVLALPAASIAFASAARRFRWLLVFSYLLTLSFIILASIDLIQQVSSNSGSSFLSTDRILRLFFPSLGASAIAALGVFALHASGFRLVRGRKPGSETDLELADMDGRQTTKLHRIYVGVFAIAAIGLNLATTMMVNAERQVERSAYDLHQRLSANGGSIKLQKNSIVQLHLPKDATDDSLLEYEKWKEIDFLSCEGTQLTDKGLNELHRFPNLNHLDLSYTKISADGLKSLHQLPNLQTLSLAGTGIPFESIVEYLKSKAVDLPLGSIDLSDLGINDDDLQQLEEIHCHSLELANNELTDQGIQRWSQKFQLSGRLDLSGNPIDGSGLTSLPPLQELILDRTNISDASAPALIAKLNINRWLSLRETKLTDASLPLLATTAIEGLRLGNGQITEKGLAMKPLNRLSWLGLNSKQFTGACLEHWSATGLVTLDLSDSAADDDAMAALLHLERLQALSLANTNITDRSLPKLAKMKSLYALNLENTSITADGLRSAGFEAHNAIHVAVGQFTNEELLRLRKSVQLIVGAAWPYFNE